MRFFKVSFGLGVWMTKPVIPSSPLQLQPELERVDVFPFVLNTGILHYVQENGGFLSK